MKWSLTASFFIILSSSLGTLLLLRDRDIWIGLITTSILLLSLLLLIIYEDPSFLFVNLFFVNHLIVFKGAAYTRFSLLGVLFFFVPLLFFMKKPSRKFPLILSVSLLTLFYLLVFIYKPYTVNKFWVLLHFEALIIFSVTQFFNWDITRIKRTVFLHLLFLCIFGLFETFMYDHERIGGPMMSATAYGVLIAIVWSIWTTIEYFRPERSFKRITIISILAISVMIATGTRMTMIGVIIALSFIFFINTFILSDISNKRKIFKLLAFGTTLIVLLAGAWFTAPEDLVLKKNFKEFQSLSHGQLDESNLGRVFVWFSSIQAFKENPMFGIGSGNLSKFSKAKFGHLPINKHYLSLIHAHNIILIILSENGLIGIIITSIIVFMALYNLISILKKDPVRQKELYGLLTGFIVMLALGMIDAIPYYPACLVWGAWFFGIMIQLKTDTPMIQQCETKGLGVKGAF